MCLLAQRHGWERKVAITQTIAREHLAQDQLGANFSFNRNGGDVGNVRKLFKTTGLQLRRRFTALKRSILKAPDENSDPWPQSHLSRYRL